MKPSWSMFWGKKRTSDILWLDLGDLGDLVKPRGAHEKWQDHGLGLLRTILHRKGILTDLLSTRAMTSWNQLRKGVRGYKTLVMNVLYPRTPLRSWFQEVMARVESRSVRMPFRWRMVRNSPRP